MAKILLINPPTRKGYSTGYGDNPSTAQKKTI